MISFYSGGAFRANAPLSCLVWKVLIRSLNSNWNLMKSFASFLKRLEALCSFASWRIGRKKRNWRMRNCHHSHSQRIFIFSSRLGITSVVCCSLCCRLFKFTSTWVWRISLLTSSVFRPLFPQRLVSLVLGQVPLDPPRCSPTHTLHPVASLPLPLLG